MKVCKECGESLSLDSFHRDLTYKDGVKSKCKDCVNAQSRAYTKSPEGKESRREIRERYKEKNSHKLRAKSILNNAVRDGVIERPGACTSCGSDQMIEAHHADYDLPLDVLWLCRPCHNLEHRRVK